jgi:prevent-host-death family protein
MDTIALSELRTNLPTVIRKISTGIDRLIITVSGKPKAVVLSLEELESLEETAEILAIPGALEAIREGEKEANEGKLIPLSKIKF